jgi:serine kinase of HPr protein (carbohydrate metabolism regulator)
VSHRLTEQVGNGLHQVVSDDRVLLRADAERHMLVRDAPHHRVEGRGVRVDELGGLGDDD